MTVIRKDMRGSPLLSYKIPIQDYSQYYLRMVVHGLQPDATIKEEAFILFDNLSLHRGDVILGRATRVWKAWREEDMKLSPDQRQVRSRPQ